MTTPEIPAVLMEGAEPHTLMRVPIRMASAVSAVLTGEAVAVPRKANENQLIAAREWSRVYVGRPIGNEAANGCYNCMLAASPWAEEAKP